MPLRTRNFIMDNTTGTIYTGVSNTQSATRDKIAAGASPKVLRTTISAPGKNTVIVTANKPINFGREVQIANISLSVADKRGKVTSTAAPQGSSITVRLRKLNVSGVETTLGTYSIISNTTTSSNTVSFNILATDSLFFDVTSIGSIKPGLGLSVSTSYFG